MRAHLPLLSVLLLASVLPVLGQGEGEQPKPPEEVTFTLVEIENFLNTFKLTYNNPKQPEEDATPYLENLKKAYLALEAKGDAATKEEEKIKDRIVDMVAKGLKARNRNLVTQECAKTLGELGSKDGVKALVAWLDKVVLDPRTPNPIWVEYGFRSLAQIGDEDPATMDLVISYACGKHSDLSVASEVMKQVIDWRKLSGKNRKELFNRMLQFMSSVFADKKNKERYERVKETGLEALSELAIGGVKFIHPSGVPDAVKWWGENKKSNWEDYVGKAARAKAEGKP